MASIKNALFIAIQEKVKLEIPDSPASPGIRESNHDIGQIDIEGVRPNVSFPWLGLDFAENNYEQKQLRKQWNKFKLSCRIAFDPFSSTSSLSPVEIREKGFAYNDIEDKLYKCLQDCRFQNGDRFYLITGLRRISCVTENRKDTLKVLRVIYEGMYEDNSLNE